MIVKEGMVVIFNCVIKDAQGDILEDSSEGPASYIHGIGMALPAIESALEGKEAGFETTISLEPEMAFGPYNDELVFSVPIDEFEGQELAVGMEFLPDEDMEQIIWRIAAIEDETVILNGNHPYAGMTLIFEIKILEVREATPKELEHGHVHLHGDEDHEEDEDE